MSALLLTILTLLQYASLSTSFLVGTFHRKTTTILLRETVESNQQYETREERFNARWNVMFERLKKYKEEHGDCLVPSKYEGDPALGNWVATQRYRASMDEKMKQERRDKLNSIGFVWSVRKQGRSPKLDKQWNDKFERLKEYKREHGNCLVPYKWPHKQLNRWVVRQRGLYANNKLYTDRKASLESIGFAWKAGDTLTELEKQWEVMFAKLEEYRDEHGDCLVPSDYKDDPNLGQWVMRQRFDRLKLDRQRRERLESIGFVWGARDQKWESMFAKLKKYRDDHGDCLVPARFEVDPQLGVWVITQRHYCAQLDSTRRERLDSIGFIWEPLEQQWENMFEKLKEYRAKHGDCLVPIRYIDDPQLGAWVSTQRHYRSELDLTRRKRLESIGFVWEPVDQQWETMFARLQEYRDEQGDCLVPSEYKEDPELGSWVSRQRHNRSKLDPARQERLESIGFVWEPVDQQWETMFARLQEYRDEQGDCLVPSEYKEDSQLGRWVQTQRRHRSKLDPARQERLESIGFVWRVKGLQGENFRRV